MKPRRSNGLPVCWSRRPKTRPPWKQCVDSLVPRDMAARQPTYAGRSLFCQTVLTQIISRLPRHLRHQPTICKTPHLDYFIESIFLWPLIGTWAAMVVTLLIYPLVGLALERAPVRAYIASLLKNYESL